MRMEKKIQVFEQILAGLSDAELDSLLERVSIYGRNSMPVNEYVNYAEDFLFQSPVTNSTECYYSYSSTGLHNDSSYNQYDYAA